MTAKIPDDLLSAFLDREVTPDEEALVRKHLQKSAQARQEFQDYQRLGQLLHELPRRTVPTEFAAAVMQQAERETLIPLDASATLPSDSQSARPFRRAWIVSLVGLVATAAAVLVVVNLPARKGAFAPAQNDAVAVRDATSGLRQSRLETPSPKAVAFDAPSSMPSSAPAAAKPTSEASVAVAKADGHFRARMKSLAPARPAAPPLNIAAKTRALTSAATPAPASAPTPALIDAGKSRMVFPADLKKAHEGDVIEALESVGDQVAVVRLTLVNRTTSLGSLQNLLVRDATRPVRGEEKEKLMKERFADKRGSVVVDAKTESNGPGELICVFVEGSRDELVGVLKGVQNQSQVQRAQLTNAISPAKLAEYAQRPVTTQSQHSRAQTLSLPHATVDKITGVATTSSGMGKGLGGQAAIPQSANDLMDLVQSATSGETVQKPGMPGQQSAPAKQSQAGKQFVAGTTQRSYQVFFVLDDQSVTESQAKAEDKAQVSPGTKTHVRPRTPVRARRPMRKRVVKPDDEGN
jgi:anti-sigma factor RsiW